MLRPNYSINPRTNASETWARGAGSVIDKYVAREDKKLLDAQRANMEEKLLAQKVAESKATQDFRDRQLLQSSELAGAQLNQAELTRAQQAEMEGKRFGLLQDKSAFDQAEAAKKQYTGELISKVATAPFEQRGKLLRDITAKEGGFSPETADNKLLYEMTTPAAKEKETGTITMYNPESGAYTSMPVGYRNEYLNKGWLEGRLPADKDSKDKNPKGKGLISEDPKAKEALKEKVSSMFTWEGADVKTLDSVTEKLDQLMLFTGKDKDAMIADFDSIKEPGIGRSDIDMERVKRKYKNYTVKTPNGELNIADAMAQMQKKDAAGRSPFFISMDEKGKPSLTPNPDFNVPTEKPLLQTAGNPELGLPQNTGTDKLLTKEKTPSFIDNRTERGKSIIEGVSSTKDKVANIFKDDRSVNTDELAKSYDALSVIYGTSPSGVRNLRGALEKRYSKDIVDKLLSSKIDKNPQVDNKFPRTTDYLKEALSSSLDAKNLPIDNKGNTKYSGFGPKNQTIVEYLKEYIDSPSNKEALNNLKASLIDSAIAGRVIDPKALGSLPRADREEIQSIINNKNRRF